MTERLHEKTGASTTLLANTASIVDSADQALYDAKHRGRHQIALHVTPQT
jgi:PleD family two-component response regulator